MLTLFSIFFVLFAGLGFSLMNTAYRLGTQQSIPVQPIAFIVALAGTTYYVAATWPVPFWHISWHVWGLGAIVGVSQYALVLLIAAALRNGPLSPMICSKYFGFVLVILMARLVWSETLSGMQAVGVALAILCVTFASLQTEDSRQQASQPRTLYTWLIYSSILAGLFIVNALHSVAFKVLGMTPVCGPGSYASLYGNHYLTTLYLTLGLCLGLDILLKAKPQGPLRWRVGLGLVAAFGSISGMSFTRLCASLPAAFTFPVIALTLLLSGSLISVFYFGERTTRAWWAMMTSGSFAASCLIADALLKL